MLLRNKNDLISLDIDLLFYLTSSMVSPGKQKFFHKQMQKREKLLEEIKNIFKKRNLKKKKEKEGRAKITRKSKGSKNFEANKI